MLKVHRAYIHNQKKEKKDLTLHIQNNSPRINVNIAQEPLNLRYLKSRNLISFCET